MQLGMIGLGRMGGNMVRRLIGGGHECVVYDRSPEAVAQLAEADAALLPGVGEDLGAAQVAEHVTPPRSRRRRRPRR